MKNGIKIILVIIGIGILISLGLGWRSLNTQIINLEKDVTLLREQIKKCCKEPAIVSRVIDGDSIELKDGREVRLQGIDAPERGQKCSSEATNRLKELIEGKNVSLEGDVKDKDPYNRLLRFVFLNNENINIKMVREGYATVYILEPNTKYEKELREAWEDCKKQNNGCLCSNKNNGKCDGECLGIQYFHWNAQGNDCQNLNDEYVTLINNCPHSCDLTSWIIKDEGRHRYRFPKFSLSPGKIVTIYTGCGENTPTNLYWCNQGYKCNAIWNNGCSGDTLYLRNAKGNLILDYHYNGFCQ